MSRNAGSKSRWHPFAIGVAAAIGVTVGLLVAASLSIQGYILLTYSQNYRSRTQRPLAHFQGMTKGTDAKPFVARALIPFIVVGCQ